MAALYHYGNVKQAYSKLKELGKSSAKKFIRLEKCIISE